MSALTVELPEKLHQKASEVAAAKNLSIDELVAIALTQSLSRLVPDPYLEERAGRATDHGLEDFLSKSPDIDPQDSDRLNNK